MIEIGWVGGGKEGYINIGNSTSSCQLQNVMTEKCRQYINKHFSSSLRFWYNPTFFVHRFISLYFFEHFCPFFFYSFRLSLPYTFICSSTDIFIRLFIYLFHYLFTLFAEQIFGCICKRDHLFLFKMAEHSTCVVFRQRLSLPLRLPSRFIHHHHRPSFEPAPSSPCVFAFYNSVSSVTFIFKLMSRSKRYLPFFIVILKLLFILFHCVVTSTLIINTS